MPSKHVHNLYYNEHFFTDFEEDNSDFEKDSLQSSNQSLHDRRRSDTSVSSFGAATLKTDFDDVFPQPVEGPHGPHLFRLSQSSSQSTTLFPPVGRTKSRNRRSRTPIDVIVPVMPDDLHDWTTQDVMEWMFNIGVEANILEQLDKNDITGTVLADMTFDNLKDLGIQSFGKRHELWSRIVMLRAGEADQSPVAPRASSTPRPQYREIGTASNDQSGSESEDKPSTTPIPRRRTPGREPLVRPLDLKDCVGIEYGLPAEHKCNKGHGCPKWKKWQRTVIKAQEFDRQLKQEIAVRYPTIPTPASHRTSFPSVIASSDVLAIGQRPAFALHADMLQRLEVRDPKESIEAFLQFQHITPPPGHDEEAGLETFPPVFHQPAGVPQPRADSKSLPRLTIPANSSRPEKTATPVIAEDNLGLNLSIGIRRDLSRSAPPVSHPTLLPPLRPSTATPLSHRATSPLPRPSTAIGHVQRPAHPALSPVYEHDTQTPVTNPQILYGTTCSRAGYMKRRRTRLLRHEWHGSHFRLHGTQLAMHADARQTSAPLDTIDVRGYHVDCLGSSDGPSAKIAAAFRRCVSRGSVDDEATKFKFELVPERQRGKTHRFAVGNGDERVEWVRDVMLAKAKGKVEEGYAVRVNGA